MLNYNRNTIYRRCSIYEDKSEREIDFEDLCIFNLQDIYDDKFCASDATANYNVTVALHALGFFLNKIFLNNRFMTLG